MVESIQELVKNKRVIFVGNSVEIMEHNLADFIDSYDIVVRFGRALEFILKTRTHFPKRLGTQADIWVTGQFRSHMYNKLFYEFTKGKLKNLTKEYLDGATPADLHQFDWVDEKDVSEIPRSYNHLVGYYKKHNKIKAIHYTQGGPWFESCKNSELSEEWWKVYKSL